MILLFRYFRAISVHDVLIGKVILQGLIQHDNAYLDNNDER